MKDKLVYSVYTENLIEIAMMYAKLAMEYPALKDTDSATWKQQFVEMANEFEDLYPNPEHWEGSDYLESIEEFARERIFAFSGVGHKPFYFTFGSWKRYPHQNTYVVVYASNVQDAVRRFREHYPDVYKDTVNCAAWYSQEQVDQIVSRGRPWYEGGPAEVIR